MKVVVVLLALFALSYAQTRCRVESYMSANFTESYYNEETKILYHSHNQIYYDAVAQRIRRDDDFYYYVSREDLFRYSEIRDYKLKKAYVLNLDTRECTVRELTEEFQPFAVPDNAIYRGQAVVGVEGSVGNYLNAAIWVGTDSTGDRYAGLWTSNCLPVLDFSRSERDWRHWNLFDVVNTVDPSVFLKPSECP